VAFVQMVDAQLVAMGIESTHDLPASDLEAFPNAMDSIPVAPPRGKLTYLRIDRHESLHELYLDCQMAALDLTICTDLQKKKNRYVFEGTSWEVPDDVLVFKQALRGAE